jgi:hypothetical protein
LIPWEKRIQVQLDRGEDWDDIREQAKDAWDGVPNDGEQGFTLFGEGAERVRQILHARGLAKETETC